MIAKLRSILFFLGYAGLTFIISVSIVLVFWILSPRRRYYLYALWCRLVIGWLRITSNVGYEIEGRENLSDQPMVVFSNHQSTWETIFLYSLLEPVVPILKKELLDIPFWGWALRLQKPIAIDRSKPREATRSLLSQGRERLHSGLSVLVFPEGTRATPGTIGKFSRSGSQLAASTGAPLVPIVHNAGDCWPSGGWVKKPGLIRVIIGEPFPSEGRTSRELSEESDAWFGTHCKELGLVPRKKPGDTS
jgi:1-acyl-sn-glycerol-3-phosphate acyltransferase